jgi:hypothetical protein
MFENMMKYKKAWDLFWEWLKEKKVAISTEIAILAILPFFFDEYNIYITMILDAVWTIFIVTSAVTYEKLKTNYINNERIEALQVACEKAFEILNKEVSNGS